jgi:hypothetical protein
VVEVAHPLARHPAKPSLLQRCCVRRADRAGTKGGASRNAVKAERRIETPNSDFVFLRKVYVLRLVKTDRRFPNELRANPNPDF